MFCKTGVLAFLFPIFVLAAEWKDYFPGKWLAWETYKKLSDRVEDETTLTQLNQAVEPEAVAALLTVLESKKSQIIYGSFTLNDPNSEDLGEQSFDGLVGLRIVRQLEIPSKKESRLLSSITTYDYDFENYRLIPRNGRDAMRIRIEIAPFIEENEPLKKPTEGFAGFSWVIQTKNGKVAQVTSESYLNNNKGNFHEKLKFPEVSVCGLANHCNFCHHRKVRSIFRPQDFEKPLEKNHGFVHFLKYVSDDKRMTGKEEELEKLRKLLLSPKEIDATDLKNALQKRWETLKKN